MNVLSNEIVGFGGSSDDIWVLAHDFEGFVGVPAIDGRGEFVDFGAKSVVDIEFADNSLESSEFRTVDHVPKRGPYVHRCQLIGIANEHQVG